MLAQHFLDAFSRKNGRSFHGFTQEARAQIDAYAWPGNVRELENRAASVPWYWQKASGFPRKISVLSKNRNPAPWTFARPGSGSSVADIERALAVT